MIIFLVFSQPEQTDTRPRAVVLLPFLGALAGEGGYALLGATPWGIAAAALIVLFAQRLLSARMPPALAIAVLAMLLRAHSLWYALDIAVATTIVWLAFTVWRRLLYARAQSGA